MLAATILTLTGSVAHGATHCQFVLGFATLKALIDSAEGPDKVGTCLENQHSNPVNGDALQQTTGGLMAWRKLDNWTAFTDGYRTWINGPNGLQARLNTEQFDWEGGEQAAPTPVPAVSTAVAVAPADFGEWIFDDDFVDALTGVVKKKIYLVAHTKQGSTTEMPELYIRCTVGETNPHPNELHELYVWWGGVYVGTTKGEYDDQVHPIAYRIGDDSVFEWDWNPSLTRYHSFAQRHLDGHFIVIKLRGLYFTLELEHRLEPEQIVIRVTKPDKTTITGVFRTQGINAAYDKLLASCGITDYVKNNRYSGSN